MHHRPEAVRAQIRKSQPTNWNLVCVIEPDRRLIGTLTAAELLARGRSKQSERAWIGISCVESGGNVRVVRISEDSPDAADEVAPGTELLAEQPVSTTAMWNQSDYRPLEGFIYAVSPFNFTAIGGNLAGAPALMGNTVVWKPSHLTPLTAIAVQHIANRVMERHGVKGVFSLVIGRGSTVGERMLLDKRVPLVSATPGMFTPFQAPATGAVIVAWASRNVFVKICPLRRSASTILSRIACVAGSAPATSPRG